MRSTIVSSTSPQHHTSLETPEAAGSPVFTYLTLGLLVFMVREAWGFETFLRVHGGYNSNSEALAHGPSTGFGQVDLRQVPAGRYRKAGDRLRKHQCGLARRIS